MRSFAASAFVPSSRTTCPFTRTCPLVINSSACRREAIPARAIIFCSLSSMVSFLRSSLVGARHFVPFFRLDLRLLFPTSLPLYLVFSLSRRRGLLRFAALPVRHSFIVRRRFFQQFLSRFHRRQIRGCSVCFTVLRRSSRDARLVSQRILRRRKSLVAPQRFPRQRLKLLQTRQLLQIAQPEPHQKFLRRLVQNRPPHHFLAPRR